MEYGADINKGNKNGFTPLPITCFNGHEDVVKYLVEHGANINKENNNDFIYNYIDINIK